MRAIVALLRQTVLLRRKILGRAKRSTGKVDSFVIQLGAKHSPGRMVSIYNNMAYEE